MQLPRICRLKSPNRQPIAVGENDAKITLYSEGIADAPKAKVEDKGSGTLSMMPLEKNCDE